MCSEKVEEVSVKMVVVLGRGVSKSYTAIDIVIHDVVMCDKENMVFLM